MIYSNIDHKMYRLEYKTFGHIKELDVVYPISVLINFALEV